MILSDVNTTKFLVNPKDKRFVNKLKKISPVFNYKLNKVNHKKSLVYIALMYDLNSELQSIKDIQQRSIEAAKLAGFNTNKDGRFTEDVVYILLGRNEKFNRAIMEYVSRINNPVWKHRVVTEYHYNKLALASMMPDNSFDSSAFKMLDDLRKKQEELEAILFNGPTLPDIKKSFYESIAESIDRLRMEQVSEEVVENGLIEWTPYPNYDQYQKLEFVGDEIPEDEDENEV